MAGFNMKIAMQELTIKLIDKNISYYEKELNALYFGLISHIPGESYQLQDKNNLYNIPPPATIALMFKDHKDT